MDTRKNTGDKQYTRDRSNNVVRWMFLFLQHRAILFHFNSFLYHIHITDRKLAEHCILLSLFYLQCGFICSIFFSTLTKTRDNLLADKARDCEQDSALSKIRNRTDEMCLWAGRNTNLYHLITNRPHRIPWPWLARPWLIFEVRVFRIIYGQNANKTPKTR